MQDSQILGVRRRRTHARGWLARATTILLAVAALFFQTTYTAAAQSPNGIVRPDAGATVRGVQSIVAVANDADFLKWQLDLLVGGDPEQPFFVGVGDAPRPHPAILQTVDSTIFPDGNHILRLRVVRNDFNYDEYFAPISIANQTQAASARTVGVLGVLNTLNRVTQLVTLPAQRRRRRRKHRRPHRPGRRRQRAAETPGAAESPTVAETPVAVATSALVALAQEKPTDGRKWIEVNLSDQTLTAWEGDQPFLQATISSGMPGHRTLPGTFATYLKYEKAHMKGDDYDTPDVPWTMYYSGDFAVHGAYWHNDFGTPVSHGCVNMRVDEAKALYDWAPLGTEVIVRP